jgi:transcription initiation factor TFIIB
LDGSYKNPLVQVNYVGEKSFCPVCKSPRLIHDYERQEIICENCGLVVEERIIDRGPEWRAFEEEEREERSRVGPPLTYSVHDKGISSDIDESNYDASGRPLPLEAKLEFNRLRRLHRRTRAEGIEKSLALALAYISRLCNHLALPKSVEETASLIYRKALNQQIIRGRLRDRLAAGCVYLACRQCKIPRTLKEIENASNVPRAQIGRSYRLLLKSLNYQSSPAQKPEDYVPKMLDSLGLGGETSKIAYQILKIARESKLTSGKSPITQAAAACYIASTLTGERRTEAQIGHLVNITEVTIRNRYREFMKNLMFEVYL